MYKNIMKLTTGSNGLIVTNQGTLTEGERLSTVDLLVLTSLDQLLLILTNTIYELTKQAIVLRKSIVLSLPL
jgi:hypothetical protein